MGLNTTVSENNNIYKISQEDLTLYPDDRRWRTSEGLVFHVSEKNPVNVAMDLYFNKFNQNTNQSNEILIDIWSANDAKETICVNKEENLIYIIYNKVASTSGLNGRIKMKVIDALNFSVVNEYDNIIITSTNRWRIHRAIIGATGEIWFLGGVTNSQKLYKMNTDGTNVQSVTITPIGTNGYNSFVLSVDNEAFIFTGGKVLVYDNNLIKTAEVSIGLDTSYYAKDSFIFGGNIYSIQKGDSDTYLAEYNIQNQTTILYNITTNHGIENATQLNTDGFEDISGEIYGTFFQKDGIKTVWWQFKLSDLSCCVKAFIIVDYDERKFQFSEDVNAEKQRMDCFLDSDNCDNTGLLTSSKGPTGVGNI